MADYYVTWEIDVTAEGPVAAALTAFDLYRATDSHATVFDVTEPDGPTYRIDLGDETLTPHLITPSPRPRPVTRALARLLPARTRRRAATWFTVVSSVLEQPA
ncbi:hypothetical protein [Nocardia xishanensis]|uniref:Uncharacterized protein n=1 Tax=Nocardia xishanensis TaxID=238964 RepID=A0ABW7XC18_9NOCA